MGFIMFKRGLVASYFSWMILGVGRFLLQDVFLFDRVFFQCLISKK